ncbi:GntR family transcriptional regulator [Streptomyces pacificus]|uniref:GntR family transcriptional regulator n=1 Tax=Streptomyces pacificus TaxID=2705029 RepID=A0A6A0B2N7_9ACTN|nr:GntR family transcriptional regulator [Streptomyces pacificus]GFH39579.1 GntR family transcriptional regulator [Streptomyces pacificus]
MPASGAVTRNTLRQQIADALRDEVLAGRLRAGQQFTVRQIAEQYGVSTTPVREALVDLAGQGLLDSSQHRGFHVRRFSAEDFRGMIEARSLIVDAVFREGGVSRAQSASAAALVSVRRRAKEAARAAHCGELNVLVGYDLRLWREFGALITNRHIADFLDRLRVQSWVFAVPRLRDEPDLGDWLWSGHEQLVDAITRGDAPAARTLIAADDELALHWAERPERRPD